MILFKHGEGQRKDRPRYARGSEDSSLMFLSSRGIFSRAGEEPR